MNIDEFVNESLKENKGYIFVYHQSQYKENISFDIFPSIVLSLKELNDNLSIFNNDICYSVIPLILYDGYIYSKLKQMIPSTWILYGPIIRDNKDLEYIISLLTSKEKELLCIIHPRENNDFLIQLKKILKNNIYTFNDDFYLDKNKEYKVMLWLLTHGQHYHDILLKVEDYIEKGFNIEIGQVLLDYPKIKEFIQRRIV